MFLSYITNVEYFLIEMTVHLVTVFLKLECYRGNGTPRLLPSCRIVRINWTTYGQLELRQAAPFSK